jgi:hypothetical protein
VKIFTWKSAQIVTRSTQVSRKLLTQLAELIASTSVSVEGNSCCLFKKGAVGAFFYGLNLSWGSRAVVQIIERMGSARAAGASLEPGYE